MLVAELGIVTEVKPLPEKVLYAMLLTESDMTTEDKRVHPLKTSPSKSVTEFGIMTEDKLVHSEKAPLLMRVTELGILNTQQKRPLLFFSRKPG